MDKMWCNKNEIGKYMYLVGKYQNKKNESKLTHTVTRIKKHYKSLRSVCRSTNMHWSQFQKYTKLSECKESSQKYIRKLGNCEIDSIRTFFHSDNVSFPLPNKKFVGKRSMKRSMAHTWKMYNLLPSTNS